MGLNRKDVYPQAAYGSGAPRLKGRRFKWTGEHRPPRKGEWFLSGNPIEAYYMTIDGSLNDYIAEPAMTDVCPTCGRGGWVK